MFFCAIEVFLLVVCFLVCLVVWFFFPVKELFHFSNSGLHLYYTLSRGDLGSLLTNPHLISIIEVFFDPSFVSTSVMGLRAV